MTRLRLFAAERDAPEPGEVPPLPASALPALPGEPSERAGGSSLVAELPVELQPGFVEGGDGNGLEIYWDTRNEPGGEDLWRGRNLPIPEEELRVSP